MTWKITPKLLTIAIAMFTLSACTLNTSSVSTGSSPSLDATRNSLEVTRLALVITQTTLAGSQAASPTPNSTAMPTTQVTVAQPTAPATPVPVPPTNAPAAQPTTEPVPPGVAVFTSAKLGLTFHYAKSDPGPQIAVKEVGDRVYVYDSTMTPEAGQWVQVFHKSATATLEDAVKEQLLKGFSLTDCLVKTTTDPNRSGPGHVPSGTTFATIGVPQSPDDDMQSINAKAAKCPQLYMNYGGLGYFMAASNAPDRFVFFSIGQYAIMAENNLPWQATLRLIANP